MNTFPLDKYTGNPDIKWITAQRITGGVWVGRYLSGAGHYPTLDKILDETPMGEMRRSELAIFRNSPRIEDAKPRLYWRGCEVPVYLNTAVSGMVNGMNSDYSTNWKR